MYRQTWLRSTTALILLAAAIAYSLVADFHGLELLQRAAILIIVALALDFVAGFGGMLSLCHGALHGVGAYAFAKIAADLGWSAGASMVAAIALSAVIGGLIGAVTARAHGIFFIMATLAFGQMLFVAIQDGPREWFGGIDGMSASRMSLSAIGLDAGNALTFTALTLAAATATYLLLALLLRTGFGRTLEGIHANESRMRALGLPVWQYKAAAFALSAALAGFAGTLAAQQLFWITPGLLTWSLSGELLIFVILGGMRSLIGPVIGVALYVFFKDWVEGITTYWHAIIGVLLIATVAAGGRGLFGSLEWHLRRLNRRPAKAAPEASPLDQAAAHA